MTVFRASDPLETYFLDNSTKWERVGADREAVSGEESYSVEAAELDRAFSVRVIMVGAEDRAVAKTREALIKNQGSRSCSGLSGTPTGVRAYPSLDKLVFTWDEPSCEDSSTNVVGYEYAVKATCPPPPHFVTLFRYGRKKMDFQIPPHLFQSHLLP